ncbi:MAG: hypothetical protein V4692_16395 [Bdellovibrionota bacterium]
MGGQRSMKKYATFLLGAGLVAAAALVLVTGAQHASATASFAQNESPTPVRYFGPEVPLPTGSALPFPWKKMDGYWNVNPEFPRVFAMKSFETSVGSRVLKVIEFDPATGREIARGLAIPVNGSQVVKARMMGRGAEYELFMGVYPDLTLPMHDPKTIFAVRTPTFDGGRSHKMIARKLSNLHD